MHPGYVLQYSFMRPLELTSYRLAKELGVSIPTINEIARRRRCITAEMAIRFARYFGTTAEFWQDLQSAYDLGRAKRKIGKSALKHIQPISRMYRKIAARN